MVVVELCVRETAVAGAIYLRPFDCYRHNDVYVVVLADELLGQIDDKAFSLNRLWDFMLKKKTLFGMIYSGRWCDVGTPEGIIEAEHMFLKKTLNEQ